MQLLLKNRIESFTWNKLYREEILKKLEFPPGYRYEDVLIMHKVFQNAKRIITIPECLYFYNIREDSITGSTRFNKSKELTLLSATYDFLQIFLLLLQNNLSLIFFLNILEHQSSIILIMNWYG